MLKVYIWLDIAKINTEPFIEIVEDRKFPYLLHYIRGIKILNLLWRLWKFAHFHLHFSNISCARIATICC